VRETFTNLVKKNEKLFKKRENIIFLVCKEILHSLCVIHKSQLLSAIVMQVSKKHNFLEVTSSIVSCSFFLTLHHTYVHPSDDVTIRPIAI